MSFLLKIKDFLFYVWEQIKQAATFSDLKAVIGLFLGLVNLFLIVTLAISYAYAEYGALIAIPYIIAFFAFYVVCVVLIGYFRYKAQYKYAIAITALFCFGYVFLTYLI